MAKAKVKKVVFVCTGNTCRSPMAEAAFADEIRKKNLSAVVSSAGLRVSPNERDMNEKAAFTLRKNGLSLPYFSSTSLTKETLLKADIIICMTRAQRDTLKAARKRIIAEQGKTRVRNNTFCFAELTGEDIPDPYGKSEDAYLDTFENIVSAFPKIIEKWFTVKPRARKSVTAKERAKEAVDTHNDGRQSEREKGAKSETEKKEIETSPKRRRNA